ncbi:MAG: TlpA family protein disulfide reductase [Myxococcales bacterium]|nr:TlpA family protein disulfide reductase [Myxococcales bacterium]MCB9540478.1 TlpA family protein disulfide reductase [Myxococcales bacterium]
MRDALRLLLPVLGLLALVPVLLPFAASAAEPAALFAHPVVDADGKPIDVAALKGKVVLFDIWATWCEPCRASLPVYEDLSKRFGPKGFAVVAVSVDESADTLRDFVKKAGFTFLVGWDPKGEWPQRMKLEVMPTAWLIGRDGTVQKALPGFDADEVPALTKAIEALLAQAP